MHRYTKTRLTLPRIVKLILMFTLFGLGSGVVRTSLAAETYRFTPLPWGIDTPAGRCVVCHSLERGGPFRVAPNLWGIIGAQKARDKGWYDYSPALSKKGGVWTVEDLDKYLADAKKYLPGTKKSISVKDPEERQKVIDFLKKLDD